MKKYLLILTSILMTSIVANEAPSMAPPKMDHFQQMIVPFSLAYQKAMEICNEKGYPFFKFKKVSWKDDTGQQFKFKGIQKDKEGILIEETVNLEGFGKTKFKIIAYMKQPTEENSCDVAAFYEMIQQFQTPSKEVMGSEVTELESFKELKEVINSEELVFVDCYGSYCGPCKIFSPKYDQYSIDLSGKGNFIKLDIQNAPELGQEYGVEAVPTVLVFKDGELQEKIVGMPKISAYFDGLK